MLLQLRHKLYKLVGSLLILGTLALAFSSVHFLSAQGTSYALSGWLWTTNYGWVSLNCGNTNDTSGVCSRSDYKVTVDSSNSVSGWGWSENFGWMCFGETCADSNLALGGVPGSNGLAAPTMSLVNNKLSGWANIISLKSNGWVHFNSNNESAGRAGAACYNCQRVCLQKTKTCDKKGNCVESDPCLKYDENNFTDCAYCFTNTRFDGSSLPSGSDTQGVTAGSGYLCQSCTGNCHKVISVGGEAYRIECATCSKCSLYGTLSNKNNGQLVGWGWNGFIQNERTVGVGWINSYNGGVVYPWLETKYGSIYSGSDVRQKSALSNSNATYCIFANSIENVTSQNCDRGFVSGVNIDFLKEANEVYYNVLGKLDITGLEGIVNTNKQTNKYGNKVVNPAGLNESLILNNSVYVFNNSLTISGDNIVFKNGVNEPGNGLIIVHGDLRINSNLAYDNSMPNNNDIKRLASVAWVVYGDVIIGDNVSHIVGAFMVLGKSGVTCENVGDSQFPHYNPNGCGVFFSANSKTSAFQPLTVLGLIFARAFDFLRHFAYISQGAERIIYDGRLNVNPPPGFKGLIEAMPVIRDFSY